MSMFQIQDTLVSLDVIEKPFCCDLERCKGCCCQEGDAGAPLTQEEETEIAEALPQLLPLMTTEARQVVEEKGIAYDDPEGERVTMIINGKDCVFARTDHKGWCYCVIEKAHNEHLIDFQKPISCHLYPIRLKQFPSFTAVEYHRWDICHAGRQLGAKLHIPLYRFLKEPIIRRFGEDYYNELELVAQEWAKRAKS